MKFMAARERIIWASFTLSASNVPREKALNQLALGGNDDSRRILLCYKVQFRLRKLANEIEQKGQNKYWFVSHARYLLWALVCQALLNHDDVEDLTKRIADATEQFGRVAKELGIKPQ